MAEPSHVRLRRLLTLVPWLAAHSGISKAEAAAHFGLSIAQLEADLELVTVTGPGLYGGELVDIYFEDATVTVYDAQGLLEPVHLTSDESASLILGLQALQQIPDEDAVVAAGLIEKLGGDGGEGLAVRVSPSPHSATVSAAIRAQQSLAITYVHPVRDDVTSRVITPWRIVTRDGVQYVHAFCHTAGAARTFRVDRISTCDPVPRASESTPEQEPGPVLHVATVELAPAFEALLERVPHEIQERSGHIKATVRYGDEEWLVRWLVECGAAVRCLAPGHIADKVARRAETGRNLYLRLH